jgi:SRSO17 transposase
MPENILKRWPRFSNYLALFESKLGRPAQQHLCSLLIAFILYTGPKNITGLNRAGFNRRTVSSLDRFITEGSWNEAEFEQIRRLELNRQVRRFLDTSRAKNQRVPAFLCIDDTNNPKTGDKTAWVSYQYSHLAGKSILCWCLVTAVMVVGHYVIPFNFRLYRRQSDCVEKGEPELFKTKVELALQLIAEWQPPCDTQPFVLVDNWYMGEELLKACSKRKFTLIGGIKNNRSVKTPCMTKSRKLLQFGPTIAASAYQIVTVGKQSWSMAGLVVELKGGFKVKLIASKPPVFSKAAGLNYWVCTDTGYSVATIMELYSVRWEIETFHKQAKQLLGLNDTQCHNERHVRRLWTLLLIAYSFLVIERATYAEEYPHSVGKELPTLGQVQRELQLQGHKAVVEWAYQAALAGRPLEAVLDQIKA